MSDNIIKGPFGKRKKKESDGISEEEIPSILLCAECGNSLFLMLMMENGDIAPVCQHCQLEFGYTADGKDGIVIQEEYEEIGLPPNDES